MIASKDVPEPFESYSGDGPYVFVSYAHADKVMVYESLRYFRKKGINLWYDEGIPPAGEWVEEIAHAIKKSVLFVVFVSPRAVDSRFVKSEVGYALSENKEILTIFLEDTTLPAGLALCLQQFQSILVSEKDWCERACATMTSKQDEIPKIESCSEDSSSVDESFDYGQQLWQCWERAIQAQTHRLGSKKKRFKKPRLPAPKKRETPIPFSNDEGVAVDPVGLPTGGQGVDAPTRGKTRHPWTVNVSVSEEAPEKNALQKHEYEDFHAGKFSWIPAGEISIWVPYAEEQRVVRVSEGFWLGQLLVTQEIYEKVMGTNPSFVDSTIEGHEEGLPVNNVSWLDSVAFCKALTILASNHGTLPAKYEFRLPTEVEWEYACRAGTSTAYYFGDDPRDLHNHAWFRGNSRKRIHPVGMKSPNPWKLYDLYGNVREWVGNSFVNTLLDDSEQDEFRISRGGGYMKSASECKSSSRSTNSLYHRFRNLGFRVSLASVPNT